MKNAEMVLNSMRYIESHMSDDLDTETIAGDAGYSKYYFHRMFKEATGMPVMDYVKKRRLARASEDILDGCGILDTALKYGYLSHSGFTKAFKREFGFSPALLRGFSLQKNYIQGGSGMSHVFMNGADVHEKKETLYQILLSTIEEKRIPCNLDKLNRVYAFAQKQYEGKKRYSGDDYITHPLNTAILTAEMEGNEDAILMGLLCDVYRKTDADPVEVERIIGGKVSGLLKQVDSFQPEEADLAYWEVIVVKLAQWLHNMRTLEYMEPEQWKEKAAQAAEYYLPIANKIQSRKAAAELNELIMKYM